MTAPPRPCTMSDGTQLGLGLDVGTVGELTVWKLRLDFLPPSKNQYDGWPIAWKASAKKRWYRDIGRACGEVGVPLGLDKVGLHARLIFPTSGRRDPQNYAQALWHWVPDALVNCGVLLDDRDGAIEIGANWGVELATDTRVHIPKEKRKRMVLTIAAHVFDAPTHTTMERW